MPRRRRGAAGPSLRRSSRSRTSALSSVRADGRCSFRPSQNGIDETLDVLDGIIFSGGGDLDPETYGAEAHPETNEVSRERDNAELALLQAALGRDMPVLAVCRGSQVLNVARGGDLVQHLPEIVGHDRHRHEEGMMADHEVRVESDSRLGSILGDSAPVKSSHHQGFGRIGDGLRESAWAEDGTIEAVEDPVAPLRARRALAPGRGRGLRALRGPRRGGRRVPG